MPKLPIYKIVNKSSNKCVGISSDKTLGSDRDPQQRNGANIRQWKYIGEKSQKWIVFALNESDNVIVSLESAKCIGVKGCSESNGANIRQWKYIGTCQHWHFNSVGNHVKISARHSGLLMGVKNCSNKNAANIRQWEDTGEKCQKWSLEEISSIDIPTIRSGEIGPGEYDFPRELELVDKYDQPPSRSKKKLVAEVLLPFFVINEPGLSQNAQLIRTPYYRLTRTQYWKNAKVIPHPGNEELDYKFSIEHGLTESTSKKIEKTTNMKIKSDLKFSFGKLFTVGLSSEISSQLKITESTSKTELTLTKEEIGITFPKGNGMTQVWWQLVDHYTLSRMDGIPVISWTIVDKNKTFKDRLEWV